MSHIVQIQTQIRDPAAVRAACARLNLAEPVADTVELYGGQVTGLTVQLPGWHYPVVCDVASGQLRFDNYGGQWGEQKQLDRFLQIYAVEKAKIEARRKGLNITEQSLATGSIILTVQVSGGPA